MVKDKEAQAQEKERKAAHRAAAKEARATRKAARASEELDKEQIYVIRKNRTMKILRGILWAMLIFVFVRGVLVCIRPDPTAEVSKTISDFRAELASYREQDNEVMAFAEGFATEYFTYMGGGTADLAEYTARLDRYASQELLSTVKKAPTGSSANVLYAQAYRQEVYSQEQTDVWVFLRVEYTSREDTGAGPMERTTTKETIVKVPVYAAAGGYIVEDTPVFVNDSTKIANYQRQETTYGPQVDKAGAVVIQEALSNFFTAYYGEQQSVISYFLDVSADQKDFVGLQGRVEFQEITNLRAYYASEADSTHITALVTVTVLDDNGVSLLQNYNMTLIYKDNQYYISSMDARASK